MIASADFDGSAKINRNDHVFIEISLNLYATDKSSSNLYYFYSNVKGIIQHIVLKGENMDSDKPMCLFAHG